VIRNKELFIRWDALPDGWVLLITYEATKENPGLTCEVGVFRGLWHKWLGSYIEHMGFAPLLKLSSR